MGAANNPTTDIMVELSETLVTDTDVDSVLHLLTDRCVEQLDVQAAGVLVADERGVLRLLAASPEHTARVTLFEAPSAPCHWCFATGQPVADADLDHPDLRWAAFAGQAIGQGFRSVTALPMRVRGEIIGVLTLLRTRVGPFNGEELRLAQALANVATVALLLQYDVGYRAVLAAQAQRLLTGRVAIERSRGILAELLGVDLDTAVEELRRHAERTGQQHRNGAAGVSHHRGPPGRARHPDPAADGHRRADRIYRRRLPPRDPRGCRQRAGACGRRPAVAVAPPRQPVV
jgi:GAF domain-containing protein